MFVPGYSLENTLSTLYVLYGCFNEVRRRVSVHLVHPISSLLKETDLMFLIRKSMEVQAECSRTLEIIKKINKNISKNYDRKVMSLLYLKASFPIDK